MKTIIMFTGHRDKTVDETNLEFIANIYEESTWIHGGAKGFDQQVESFAVAHSIPTKVFLPEYSKFPYKQAPIIRNKSMLDICDIVVACYDGRNHGGTHFVVTEAKKLGKKLIIFQPSCHISKQQG